MSFTFFGGSFGEQIGLSFVLLVVGIIVIRFGVRRAVSLVLSRARGQHEHLAQRVRTLTSLLSNTGMFFLWIIVIMMLLDAFGADIRPLLAGAGVLGVAIGFGGQSLVKDLVSGIFILLEDQFAVGDEVKISGYEGKVVELSIRSTVIRTHDGALVFLPNGSLVSVANYSKPTVDISRGISAKKETATTEKVSEMIAKKTSKKKSSNGKVKKLADNAAKITGEVS